MASVANTSATGLGPGAPAASQSPQLALLEFFFPGISIVTTAVARYLHIDISLYIPLIILLGAMTFAWAYISEYLWSVLEAHFMSTVDIRTDDEIYNIMMAWIASQKFAQSSRRFVVNTQLGSRNWWVYRQHYDENEDDDDEAERSSFGAKKFARKALAYTPAFGSHYFWYKGRLLLFRRHQNREQAAFLMASEREEISLSCFGRNPWVLKELLHMARLEYLAKDEQKTLIYRGTTKSGSTEPTWQRSMARTSRPLSTVILNEKVKKELLDDVTDYLSPATRRWYANRGIPYRRGYLLYGPPGTGKSSLSLALAGHFKMRIYIVSLSSVTANEENLAALFAELPRRCVVLLEDIDTAGLTHTRDDGSDVQEEDEEEQEEEGSAAGQKTRGKAGATTKTAAAGRTGATTTVTKTQTSGRLSLSGLLNILDGVASQEGRVLFMTTNHLEKLDKALIRPGRVDMVVKFDYADRDMTIAIFRAIYATLEGDTDPNVAAEEDKASETTAAYKAAAEAAANSPALKKAMAEIEEQTRLLEAERKRKADEEAARVEKLAVAFADAVPAHEFSPAEIQGFLLKNKRNPEAAVAKAAEWVAEMRKERKEKQLREAEEKREAERKKKEEEAEKQKKEEEEKAEAEAKQKKKEKKEERRRRRKEKEREKRRKRRAARKDGSAVSDSDSDSDSDSSSSSDSDSGSGCESAKEKRVKAAAGAAAPAAAASKPEKSDSAGMAAAAAPTTADEKGTASVDIVAPVVVAPAAPVPEAATKDAAVVVGNDAPTAAPGDAAVVPLKVDADLSDERKHGGDSGYGTS